MVGRDVATVVKASDFSFEPLRICSSFQAMKLSSQSLTRHIYLVTHWSRVLYSPFTWPITRWKSLCIMIFSKDTEIARSIPARIASYSISLLDTRKSNRIAYSILSSVGALSCKPTPAPVCREAPSTLSIHQSTLPGSVYCWGILLKSLPISIPLLASGVYTGYRTHLA